MRPDPARRGDRTVLVGVMALLIAMISFQLGASVAKILLPLLGAKGAPTVRSCYGGIIAALVGAPFGVHEAGWALLSPTILPATLALGCLSSHALCPRDDSAQSDARRAPMAR